jgi:hypothetical protein
MSMRLNETFQGMLHARRLLLMALAVIIMYVHEAYS